MVQTPFAEGSVQVVPLPGPAMAHRYGVLFPTPGKPVSGIILSNRPVGVLQHYIDKRSCLCTQPRETCEGCLRGWEPVWKGYLAVLVRGVGRKHLMQLTAECVRKDDKLNDPAQDLRGYEVQLERMGAARNALVRAVWLTNSPTHRKTLCAGFDVLEAVKVLYGRNANARLESGHVPPLPVDQRKGVRS